VPEHRCAVGSSSSSSTANDTTSHQCSIDTGDHGWVRSDWQGRLLVNAPDLKAVLATWRTTESPVTNVTLLDYVLDDELSTTLHAALRNTSLCDIGHTGAALHLWPYSDGPTRLNCMVNEATDGSDGARPPGVVLDRPRLITSLYARLVRATVVQPSPFVSASFVRALLTVQFDGDRNECNAPHVRLTQTVLNGLGFVQSFALRRVRIGAIPPQITLMERLNRLILDSLLEWPNDALVGSLVPTAIWDLPLRHLDIGGWQFRLLVKPLGGHLLRRDTCNIHTYSSIVGAVCLSPFFVNEFVEWCTFDEPPVPFQNCTWANPLLQDNTLSQMQIVDERDRNALKAVFFASVGFVQVGYPADTYPGRVERLWYVAVEHRDAKPLSRAVCALTALKGFRSNVHNKFPSCFYRSLNRLESIDVSKSHLSEWPFSVSPLRHTMPRLRFFNVSYNNIRSVPANVLSGAWQSVQMHCCGLSGVYVLGIDTAKYCSINVNRSCTASLPQNSLECPLYQQHCAPVRCGIPPFQGGGHSTAPATTSASVATMHTNATTVVPTTVRATTTTIPSAPGTTVDFGTQHTDNAPPVLLIVAVVGALCAALVLVVAVAGMAVFFAVRRRRRAQSPAELGALLAADGLGGSDDDIGTTPSDGGADAAAASVGTSDNSAARRSRGTSTVLHQHVLDAQAITIERQVGEGAFGAVYLGQWRRMDVAIKQMHPHAARSASAADIAAFRAEARRLATLRPHRNIVQFCGVVLEPTLCIVTRFADGGSLADVVYNAQRYPALDDAQCVGWARGIAHGLAHLHAEGVVHRDLATRNVLLADERHRDVLITDFGMSRDTVVGDDADAQLRTTTTVGPVRWMAPEQLQSSDGLLHYSKASDVYSFGCCVSEIYTRRVPLADVRADSAVILAKVNDGRTPSFGAAAAWLADVATGCVAYDAAARPTAMRVCELLDTACDSGAFVSTRSAPASSSLGDALDRQLSTTTNVVDTDSDSGGGDRDPHAGYYCGAVATAADGGYTDATNAVT